MTIRTFKLIKQEQVNVINMLLIYGVKEYMWEVLQQQTVLLIDSQNCEAQY